MDKQARLRVIVAWSLAFNAINRKSISGSISLTDDGEQRLLNCIAFFVQQYDDLFQLCRLTEKWEEFVLVHAQLALTLRDGIFVGRGPETGRDLLLGLLVKEGFRPRSKEHGLMARAAVLDALQDGSITAITAAIKDGFISPSGKSAEIIGGSGKQPLSS